MPSDREKFMILTIVGPSSSKQSLIRKVGISDDPGDDTGDDTGDDIGDDTGDDIGDINIFGDLYGGDIGDNTSGQRYG